MTKLKIGDRVTWGGKPKVKPDGSRLHPIGIANCVVKELATDPRHGECARISHWLFKGDWNLDNTLEDGTAWAKVSDLEKE